MQPVIIYCTFPNQEEAEKVGQILLDKRLVACVKIIEKITSLYWWEGKVNRDSESMFILESTADHFAEIVALIEINHSYKTPVITKINVEGTTDKVLEWLKNETLSI
jgi:periplasmic divalent cation tolerance protein